MSQVEEEAVLGLNKTELTDISGQGTEGQLLKIVKIEPQESFSDTEMQHTEEVLEENQVINGWLK